MFLFRPVSRGSQVEAEYDDYESTSNRRIGDLLKRSINVKEL